MLYLTCTTITSVDLAHYGVSRAKDWVSVAGWLVVLGLTALSDSISVYSGPSPKEREKEKR